MSKSEISVLYAVIILMLLQFVITVEMSVVMPMAPVIATIFHVRAENVTLLNIGYALSGLFAPIFGFWADKTGMKRILILSSALFAFGCGVISFSDSAIMYFFSRAIIGVGYYAMVSLCMSYTAYLVSDSKLGQVSGFYKVAFAIGVFISPLLGDYLVKAYSFRFLYLCIMAAALAITLGLMFIPKVHSQSEGIITIKEVKHLFSDKAAQYMMICCAMLSVPAIFFYNYFSVYLAGIGVSQSSISWSYSIIAAGSILAGIVIILFSDRVGKMRMAMIGIIGSAIFVAPFAFELKAGLIVISFLFGFAYDTIWGLFYPIGSLMFRRESATFLTMLSLTMSLTNVLTNYTGPIVNRLGGFSLGIVICVISLIVSAIYLRKAAKLKEVI